MQAAIQGLLYGLGISFMLGTVFFALIQQGLKFGVKAGVFIAIGVILTDIFFIALAFFFTDLASTFIQSNRSFITLLGAGFIIVFGLVGVLTTNKQEEFSAVEKLIPLRMIALGAVLNATNPVNFFVWLSLQVLMLSQGFGNAYALTFYGFSLFAIFLAEVGIATFAYYLKNKLNEKVLLYLKNGINLLFIGIGVILLLKALPAH